MDWIVGINGWKGGEKLRKIVEKWLKMGCLKAGFFVVKEKWLQTCKTTSYWLCYSTRHADPRTGRSRGRSSDAGRDVRWSGSVPGRTRSRIWSLGGAGADIVKTTTFCGISRGSLGRVGASGSGRWWSRLAALGLAYWASALGFGLLMDLGSDIVHFLFIFLFF